MSEFALIDADCEANGHPTECTEPAPGSVEKQSSVGITVTVNGTTKEVATTKSSTLSFPSHAHDHDSTNGCHDYHSHDIGNGVGADGITVDGSAEIFIVDTGVTSDPITGGSVDIVQNPVNTGIQQ